MNMWLDKTKRITQIIVINFKYIQSYIFSSQLNHKHNDFISSSKSHLIFCVYVTFTIYSGSTQ